MQTQIIPFDSPNLPASITGLFSVSDDLSNGVGSGGFPHVSIKGKVFHISRGDDRQLVTQLMANGETVPAPTIDVVIVKANPNVSKVYYTGGYTEGSEEKPACYSNDGIAPASDAATPQSNKCAVCAHNQWGSRITDNGKKAKSCVDSRRIAIAPIDQINDPMLLRVPAASLVTLAQHADALKKRNVPYQAVVTRIGFDHSVAHPALTFKPIGFIDQESAAKVQAVMNEDVVKNILGLNNVGGVESSPAPTPVVQQPVVQQPVVQQTTIVAPMTTAAVQPVVQPVVQAAPVQKVIEVASADQLLQGIDAMLAGA